MKEIKQKILKLLEKRQITPQEAYALLYPDQQPDAGQSRVCPADEPIAVIGMHCCFPGGLSLEQYWQSLLTGTVSISDAPQKRWDLERIYRENNIDPGQACRQGALLDKIDTFDAAFFGLADEEALQLDPQQRIMLEVAYQTLLQGGYCRTSLWGKKVGLFIGAKEGCYQGEKSQSGVKTSITANGANFIPGRISDYLNAKGPSLVYYTACSSSLVSIHYACQSLLSQECELALAGGVEIKVSPAHFVSLNLARALSPSGECRTFDQNANGIVPGEGAGAVLLKRLSAARAQGDHIYGLIRGSAINNDGNTMGITTPDPQSQQAVILQALEKTGLDPQTISYVEAHGTGTMLGDPIELKALSNAYRTFTQNHSFCGIGSVKTNIGLLDTAAGIAGFIKVMLSLYHKTLLPARGCDQPNTRLDLTRSPFYLVQHALAWEPLAGVRRAGINGFGFGGTNCHMIVEEAPSVADGCAASPAGPHLLCISGHTEAVFLRQCRDLHDFLVRQPALDYTDLIYTLACGRDQHAFRLAVPVASRSAVLEVLQSAAPIEAAPGRGGLFIACTEQPLPDLNLINQLVDRVPGFKQHCQSFFQALTWFRDQTLELILENAARIDQRKPGAAIHTALQYLMGRLLADLGLKGEAFLGSGLGMAAAAALSGLIGEPDLIMIFNRFINDSQTDLYQDISCRETHLPLFNPLLSGIDDEFEDSLHDLLQCRVPLARQWQLAGAAKGDLFCLAGPDLFPSQTGTNSRLFSPRSLEQFFTCLAHWFNQGRQLDLSCFYDPAQGYCRIGLPLYPLERKIYWIEQPDWNRPGLADSSLAASKAPAFRSPCPGLYSIGWEALPEPVKPGSQLEPLLIFGLDSEPVRSLLNELAAQGRQVIPVFGAEKWSEKDGQFWINFQSLTDVEKIFKKLPCQTNMQIVHAVQFAQYRERDYEGLDFAALQLEQSVGLLFHIVKCLGRQQSSHIHLTVLTSSTLAVHQDEQPVLPANTALIGFVKAVSREYARLDLPVIDCPPGDWKSGAKELLNQKKPAFTAIRGSQRYRSCFVPQPDRSFTRPAFKKGGTYLLTGGRGGIGLATALYLAQTYQANLILFGRSPLPERPAWPGIIAGPGQQDLAKKISLLQKIESSASRLILLNGDVTREQDVKHLQQEIEARGLKLDGLLHLAGCLDDGLIALRKWQDFKKIMAPKINGALLLIKYFAAHQPGQIIFYSSTASLFGNAGQANYAAANSFLDGYAAYLQKKALPAAAIQWPLWTDTGMGSAENVLKVHKERGLADFTQAAGMQVLEAVAANGLGGAIGVVHDPSVLKLIKPFIRPGFLNDSLPRVRLENREAGPGSPDPAGENPGRVVNEPGPVSPGNRSVPAGTRLKKSCKKQLIREAVSCLIKEHFTVEISCSRQEETFFNLSLGSLQLVDLARLCEQAFHIELNPALFFEYQSLAAFTDYLYDLAGDQIISSLPKQEQPVFEAPSKTAMTEAAIETGPGQHYFQLPDQSGADHNKPDVTDIAVIGAAGQFPGAKDLSQFWQNLAGGRDCVQEIPDQRLDIDALYDPVPATPHKTYLKHSGLIPQIDYFDAPFFSISPKEARAMDPQQRLMLEVSYHTLESAGYGGKKLFNTRTGVYIGASHNHYRDLMFSQPEKLDSFSTLGNTSALLANRLSYYYNFHGPSLVVDTLCSSSLVAIHLACQALCQGECDYALAGGAFLLLGDHYYVAGSQIQAFSADGHCKTFDRSANGYAPGETVSTVLLKPLTRAVLDRDHILAVIKGSSVNHGGKANNITTPNVPAQAAVIKQALQNAGLKPGLISYLEAHGTGTHLGDPVEITALKKAFQSSQFSQSGPAAPAHCALGSIKSMIGHGEPAAGIAGLVKIILALQHAQIPPSLHVNEPNHLLDLIHSPFYINDRLHPWTGPLPLRAGLSSFGLGGTNAHLILEQAPAAQSSRIERFAQKQALFVFSARNKCSFQAGLTQYLHFFDHNPACNLFDAAYTSATGRGQYGLRFAALVSDHEQLKQAINRALAHDPEQDQFHWFDEQAQLGTACHRHERGDFDLILGEDFVVNREKLSCFRQDLPGLKEELQDLCHLTEIQSQAVLFLHLSRLIVSLTKMTPRISGNQWAGLVEAVLSGDLNLARAMEMISHNQLAHQAIPFTPGAKIRLILGQGSGFALPGGAVNLLCHDYNWPALQSLVMQLYLAGLPIDWDFFYQGKNFYKVNLPLYAYDRKAYWMFDRQKQAAGPAVLQKAPADLPHQKRPQPEQSLHAAIIRFMQDKLEFDPEEIDLSISLFDYGFDSMVIVELGKVIESAIGTVIDPTQLLEYPSLEAVIHDLSIDDDQPPATGPGNFEDREQKPDTLVPDPDNKDPDQAAARNEKNSKNNTTEKMAEIFIKQIVDHLEISRHEIDRHDPLESFGFDSMFVVTALKAYAPVLGEELDPSLLYDFRTISDFAAYLAERFPGAGVTAADPVHAPKQMLEIKDDSPAIKGKKLLLKGAALYE